MIDVYSWSTGNARKVYIMLEETGLDYRVHPINISKGDQFGADFLAISPNNRIPAIIDRDGPGGAQMSLMESGAILYYLAEKTGMLLPTDGEARYRVMEWLMFQMGGVGPMFGQCNHFRRYARETIPYAIDRYTRECGRLYRVMEKRLADRDFIAGDYSIADMALYPWCRTFDWRGQDPDEVPRVKAWVDRVEARPAVQRAMDSLAKSPRSGPIDEAHWENMYGETQYLRR